MQPVARGRLITFEGGEGGGKSTQARRLAERLRAAGHEVVLTREPGGSEGAEALRDLLVSGRVDRWSSLSETLLMNAARADHLERVIRPALARGAWIVCDRFMDSTRAYQGAAGGVAPEVIAALETAVVGADRPDLTLVLDMGSDAGLARALARDGTAGRFEEKGRAFHERLRQAFLQIAEVEPDRCVVIAADDTPQAVAEAVWSVVQGRLAS